MGFVITYLALWLLRQWEDRMPGLSYKFVTVIMQGSGDEESITSAIKRYGAVIEKTDYERNVEHKESMYDITISFKGESSTEKLLDELSSLQNVKRVMIRS
jgi:uncharacterized membrane protein YhiD involved in acid resistance